MFWCSRVVVRALEILTLLQIADRIILVPSWWNCDVMPRQWGFLIPRSVLVLLNYLILLLLLSSSCIGPWWFLTKFMIADLSRYLPQKIEMKSFHMAMLPTITVIKVELLLCSSCVLIWTNFISRFCFILKIKSHCHWPPRLCFTA